MHYITSFSFNNATNFELTDFEQDYMFFSNCKYMGNQDPYTVRNQKRLDDIGVAHSDE